MSPKLKPLLLPQLVEERRKAEVESLGFGETSVYLADNNSSSDLITPLTPTFSHRGGHMRASSSISSLDIPPNPSLPGSEGPSSPNQTTHAAAAHGKRQLPDVQEEDSWERDERDLSYHEDAHWCLCISSDNCQCHVHRVDTSLDMCHSTIPSPEACEPVDWDLGSLSDSDFSTRSSSLRKRRMMAGNSTISGLTTRFNSRLSGLSRWRSTSRRRANSTFTAGSESALDRDHSLSRVRSSRSSSLSAPGRPLPDRTNEPPLPPTPALSFYESTDSLAIRIPVDPVEPVDLEPVDVGYSLERDRAMATTPLLPPLLMDPVPISQPPSVQQSPLQSPSIAPAAEIPDFTLVQQLPSPPLSTKISIASFRPTPCASLVLSAPASPTEILSPIPSLHILEPQDAWADRLGHANFIITPKPYTPEAADLESVRRLRADWDRARANYTKHLIRTGEHYGTTSKTYGLTEKKWAEIENEWLVAHDSVLARISSTPGNRSALSRPEPASPAAAPPMLDTEKFPDLGDEDIVGPMLRDTVMVRDDHGADDKSSSSKFWKTLVEKLGALRK